MRHTTPDLIKVVGMSASGKSTLVQRLRELGYDARPVSQEHSHVPSLWQQFDPPHVLIHLDVSLAQQCARRPDVTWSAGAWQDEHARLAHARDHAGLKVDTSAMTPEQVAAVALHFLRHRRVRRAGGPLPPVARTGSAQV